jgi:nitrate/TMAO reductase-like tetraheme cytochrome c subunit
LNTIDFFRPKKSKHFSARNGVRATDKQRVIG